MLGKQTAVETGLLPDK